MGRAVGCLVWKAGEGAPWQYVTRADEIFCVYRNVWNVVSPSNVDHPTVEDGKQVVIFYGLQHKAGEKSEDTDGPIWLFTSYVLSLGSCEIPPVTELIAIA